MKKILTKKGFTLIELIVVIAILAILAAILIPSLTNYLAKAEQAKNLSNARSAYTELTLKMNTDAVAPVTPYVSGSVSCPFTVSGKIITSVTCGTGTNAQTFTP